MTLGEQIKALRNERGLTQEYLAGQMQVTRQAVSKWENDLASPSMENLLELSRLFAVPLEQLTGTAAPAKAVHTETRRPEWLWRLLWIMAAALLISCVLGFLLFALWGEHPERLASSGAASPKAAYERLSDYVLGETPIELSDGRSVWLRLVMTEGEYFTEEYENYLPGGGVFPVNYQGSYRLEVRDTAEELLCAYPLNADFDSEMMNFPGEVSLSLFDYNWDGRPELTIGQYGSSSILLYALYTIAADGRIERSCPELIADSRDITRFSVVFPRGEGEEGKGFCTSCWNNAIGGLVEQSYRWDPSAGQFLFVE